MPKRKPVQNKHAKRPGKPSKRAPRAKVTDTTFPASEATPGQAKSRASFSDFQAKREQCPWWLDLMRLMQEGRFDWRKAAYIAWAASPYKTRWPATLKGLCDEVLGCSDSVVHKWRRMNPEIDKRVAQEQVAPLMLHRADVIDALITVASTADSYSHSDRKLFLEMTGDYKPKSATTLSGPNDGPIKTEDVGLTDEQRTDRIVALLETARARRDGSAVEQPAARAADQAG